MVKYFIDRNGVQTRRIAGNPGAGHIEVALSSEASLDTSSDIYAQMFRLGYVRVVEMDAEIHVDAPKALTRPQRHFIEDRALETRKQVFINDRAFVESRDTKAQAQRIVDALMA